MEYNVWELRVHLQDQVGRSFSMIKVNMDSVDCVATAKRPELQSRAVTYLSSGRTSDE